MKSEKLSHLVARLFGDEGLRTRFMSDPGEVMSGYSLDENEKKAVMNLHARLGLVSGDSTRLEAVIWEEGSWF